MSGTKDEQDGTTATGRESVRLLSADEYGQIADHLLRLDPLSRYMRFGGQLADSAVSRHARRLAANRVGVIGYFVDEVLRGIAELHPLPVRSGRPAAAEIAFSIERGWQGRGIGRRLMDRVVAHARGRGFEDLMLVFLASNGRMKRMAVERGATLTDDADEVIASFPTPVSVPFGWARETVRGLSAAASAAAALPRRLATGSAGKG